MNEILEARREIDQIRKKIHDAELDKNQHVSLYLFNKFMEESDVPFNVLNDFPYDKEIYMPVIQSGTIRSVRHRVREDLSATKIRMNTVWSSGATQRRHYHSDARETILVLQGTLMVHTKYERYTISEGEQISFEPGEVHLITALEKSETLQIFDRTIGIVR